MPIGYAPRPTVQLLDGTGDAGEIRPFPLVVARGAEITVIGNALRFDVAETSVVYHDIVDADRAERRNWRPRWASRSSSTRISTNRPISPLPWGWIPPTC